MKHYVTVHYDASIQPPSDRFFYTEAEQPGGTETPVPGKHHHPNHKDWIGWQCKDGSGSRIPCTIQFDPKSQGEPPDCPFIPGKCTFPIVVGSATQWDIRKIKNHRFIGDHHYKYTVTIPNVAQDDPDIQVDGAGSWPFMYLTIPVLALLGLGVLTAALFGFNKFLSRRSEKS